MALAELQERVAHLRIGRVLLAEPFEDAHGVVVLLELVEGIAPDEVDVGAPRERWVPVVYEFELVD